MEPLGDGLTALLQLDSPMVDQAPLEAEPRKATQFRLSTIFVLTLIAGILAAFLSPRGNDLMLSGMISVVGTALFALAVGHRRPPLADRVFWGVVIAAMMQAVCAETTLLDRTGIYAWPLSAGFAAVIAAGPASLYRRMALSAAMAGTIIAGYVVSLGGTTTVVIAYVSCAAIGGALMTILVDSVNWLERKLRIPQPAIGLVLVLGAMGFALGAPRVIPGW